ncbi:MAG: metallophosphoesterase [Lachnospiraceae bacterium]|nr:metallophosphoesterase [Lachnospiraceae bacterium]
MKKKVLIVSDSHGRHENVLAAIDMEKPIDYLFHLGDLQGREAEIEEAAGCPAYMVAGNCDFFSSLPSIRLVEIGSHRILLAHGHQFRVSSQLGTRLLRAEALKAGCDLAVFGHIHQPVIERDEEITVLNPGSIASPRQADRRRTYMVLELEDGKAPEDIEVKYL